MLVALAVQASSIAILVADQAWFQLSEPALDTPDSVHCSSLLGKSDDVDSIEVLKTALGIRFEYHHPWWFRLAGMWAQTANRA